MSLRDPHYSRLFETAEDGRLLFLAAPTARTGYVVPDAHRAEALRVASRNWGLCELASITVVAPLALHFGALGLLAAIAVLMLGSGIAYRIALHELLSGLVKVSRHRTPAVHRAALAASLRMAAEETHLAVLWFIESASLLAFLGALLIVFHGHRLHHLVGGFIATIFFGAALIVGAYLLSIRRRWSSAASVSRPRFASTGS